MLTTGIRFTEDLAAATTEIEQAGGHVTQQLTDTAFIAALPDTVDPASLRDSQPTIPVGADEPTIFADQAWKDLLRKREESEGEEEEYWTWDNAGHTAPPPYEEEPGFTLAARHLNGSVSLGLVIVSGTEDNRVISETERKTILREVAEGLDFLTTSSPRPLRFVYNTSFITVDAKPRTDCPSKEACEKIWRDPALAQLGYEAGEKGYNKYAQDLREKNKTDWAYVAFITKYPQEHHAYARGIRLCMTYANNGWGPDKINKGFSHETLHIFGARDEYDNCSCAPSGRDQVPNKNCNKCTTKQVACIMDGTANKMCKYTRGQIGWGYDPLAEENLAESADTTAM